MMSIQKVIEELLGQPKYGKGIGLHRMDYLTQELQDTDWWQSVAPINVVGTDGKGSVATMIAAILHELNIDYGKYTSPHLFKFHERIEINQSSITDQELTTTWDFIKNKVEYSKKAHGEEFSAFEIFTAIALYHFQYHQTKTVILEAGIGGRYDSTRILTGNIAALTSVGLEHTELLGNSLEAIAFDKMDITNVTGTLIVGQVEPKLLKKIKTYAKLKWINLLAIQDLCEVEKVTYEDHKMVLDLKIDDLYFHHLECNLIGEHQISNVQVAILVVSEWLKNHEPNHSKEKFISAIYRALPNLVWEGRFEQIHYKPTIYIDVGHTLQAFKALKKTIQDLKKDNILFVLGFSKKRPIEDMLKIIYPMAGEIICTQAYHRGTPSDQVFEVASNMNWREIPIHEYSNLEAAIEFAKERANENNQDVMVLGSMFLAIETFYYLNDLSPQSLTFF